MMDDDLFGKKEIHPSYGQISVNRVSAGRSEPFYGSSLKHSNWIEIEIKESELYRSRNADRYMDGKNIVRVRMTENQFATMITSLNLGGGTPCTVTRIKREQVEGPPFRNEKDQIHQDFKQEANTVIVELKAALEKLQALTEPGAKISKAALNDLQKDLEKAIREVGSNMPYVVDQFTRNVDSIVADAQHEIEAHVGNALHRAGLDALKEKFNVQMLNAPNPHEPNPIMEAAVEGHVRNALLAAAMKEEYPTFQDFKEAAKVNGLTVDQCVRQTCNDKGDTIGKFVLHESGAVTYRVI